MCLAIPMRVIKIKESADDMSAPQVAIVDTGGIQKEIRLDVVNRLPNIGDYVLVHAGFAIYALDEQEAEINLRLLRDVAEGKLGKR
ncbi:MAG: HypC/HybG/HupF family hydrogenase formation chaperone [Deltaproteobacteria bacterium]|nr:MAG: HypC/HybG/HupF family hydrogenase formation chaperone [Deltaproteobacteria bacterium]